MNSDHLGSSKGTAENLAECPNCYDGGQCDECAAKECTFHLQAPSAALYFAARAPEVPGWFERKFALKVVDIGNGMKGAREVLESHEDQFFRWRWYYADGMLRTRSRPE